jgi:CubicO group peptidase (beta-lactamase class C family)
MIRFLFVSLTLAHASATIGAPTAQDAGDALCAQFRQLSQHHEVNTAGAALIRDGRVSWTCFAGEEQPGVPASERTRFNVASITKIVVTEAILTLVDDGRLDLGESMASWWVDPDLADDPRHRSLTPRLVLTHQTGLPNWRFFDADRKLRFLRDPGSGFGYSGEAFHYLAEYAARKLETPFAELVDSTVFEPLGIDSAEMTAFSGDTRHFARSVDAQGIFPGFWCRPGGWCQSEGFASSAGGLRVNVGDLASFLLAAADGLGYGPSLLAQRNRVHTPLRGDDAAMRCGDEDADAPLPEQGYGLGWRVLRCDSGLLLFHGGSDWAEVTVAAIAPASRDGLVVLLNAPNLVGARAMPDLLALIDPGSPLVGHYERRRRNAEAGQ